MTRAMAARDDTHNFEFGANGCVIICAHVASDSFGATSAIAIATATATATATAYQWALITADLANYIYAVDHCG